MASRRTPSATTAAVVLLGTLAALIAKGEARAEDARPADQSAPPTGVLCLRKLPAPIEFATEGKGSADFDYQDTSEARARRMAGHPQLLVSVDRGETVIVDQTRSACIDGLSLDTQHVVRVSRPGVRRQVARFSFARGEVGGDVRELRYEPFYGNVHVERSRRTATATAACTSCPDAAPTTMRRNAGSLRGNPAPEPRVRAQERRKLNRHWPKLATVTGPEEKMVELPRMEGVTVLDHGERRVYPDAWEVEVVIRDARAAAALRARGIRVELGDAPTERELQEEFRPDTAEERKPRR